MAAAGVDLFEAVCARDLEGVDAKLANAPYTPEARTGGMRAEDHVHEEEVARIREQGGVQQRIVPHIRRKAHPVGPRAGGRGAAEERQQLLHAHLERERSTAPSA